MPNYALRSLPVFRIPCRPLRTRVLITSLLLGLCLGLSVVASAADPQKPAATSSEKTGKPIADPAIEQIDAFIKEHPVDKEVSNWRTRLTKPPELDFDPKHTYYWKLETNVGTITFKLFAEEAPMHVSSTIYLTRLGFYDTLNFHRVIMGFMAQGGDPLRNGRGGPGYRYDGEFSPTVLHDSAGILSMANAGPGTDGSQFFITFKATPGLNHRHTVFGKAEGAASMETLKAMEALGQEKDPAPPREPLVIKRATILVK